MELTEKLRIFADGNISINMEKKDYQTALSLKKMEFIRQIVSETSLDTLCSWLDMYEEARYVASLSSDEEELKEFCLKYEESIKKGFSRNRRNNVEP